MTKMLVSVAQSEVFNRYTAARLADPRPLLLGEVVRLAGSGSVFTVTDPAAEAQRLTDGDIVRTGPLPGRKSVEGTDDAGTLERAAAAAAGVDAAVRDGIDRKAPGTRRDLRVPIPDLTWEVTGPGALVLHFSLPSGSYATQVVREFTRRPWRSPLRPARD